MSKPEYLIKIIGERASDIHRSRNMAEDINVQLTEKGIGTTSNPDTMTTEFNILIEKKRKIGEATELIKKIISNHLMEQDVKIEKLS